MAALPKEVAQFIETAFGDKAKSVASALETMGRATDTDLSELLSERPSHIRKILYSLYEARLADYEEHREPGTGWLTFVWTLTPETGQRAIAAARAKAADELRSRIDYERTHDFYLCPRGHGRVEFDQAMGRRFKCADCGCALEHDENAQLLAELMKQLQSLDKGTA